MRHSVRLSVMALIAMFAFSSTANAQFGLGKLARKVRKAVGVETQQDKYEEIREQQAKEEKVRQFKRDSVKAVMASITPTIPQPAVEGTAPVAIKWKGTPIGSWDPVRLEITFNKTYDDGEFAGQNVSYKLDPSTGQWTSKKGTNVGSMSNDGTIVSPNLGTIKFNPQTNAVVRNGEVIGEVTMLNASSYGTSIGSFEGHVSPLLVAFTFHGSLVSENQISEWKEAKRQREVAAAKARQEAAARAAAQRSSSSSSRNMDLYLNGSRFGEIRSNGDVFINGSRRGEFRSNGDVYVNGSRQGEIRSNGDIYKNGSRIGEVRSNGDIYLNGSRIGEVRSNGDIYKNGSRIGEARSMSSSDVRKVAVIYFYGFF